MADKNDMNTHVKGPLYTASPLTDHDIYLFREGNHYRL